jgi:hypothetical protein
LRYSLAAACLTLTGCSNNEKYFESTNSNNYKYENEITGQKSHNAGGPGSRSNEDTNNNGSLKRAMDNKALTMGWSR